MASFLGRLFTQHLFSLRGAKEYQRGIARRYAEQSERWAEHLHRSQKEVQDFVAKYQPHVLYVLGSGWLLDLPMDYLLQNVPDLHLVDIAHPRPIVARYKKQPSVTFDTLDLTGGLVQLLEQTPREHCDPRQLLADIQAITPPSFYNQRSASVISLNLLSQLPYPLLNDENASLLGDYLEVACASLQKSHIEWMRAFKHALMIFDFEEVRNMPHYASPELVPTVYTPLPTLQEKKGWIWLFDCNGSYIHNMTTHLRVAAGELETNLPA